MFKIFSTYKMQRLEVSGAVQPIYGSVVRCQTVKMYATLCVYFYVKKKRSKLTFDGELQQSAEHNV